MYREQLGPDGKTLMYRLPAEGGATPGTPASLDGKPILEPYAALEVRVQSHVEAYVCSETRKLMCVLICGGLRVCLLVAAQQPGLVCEGLTMRLGRVVMRGSR